jgi:N-acetylneuraminic acid mutarotase
MKNSHHLNLIFILIISAFVITCSKESPTESNKLELSVNLTSYTFTKNVTRDTLIISNSGAGELSWEITEKPDWLELSKSSGTITTTADIIIMTANVNRDKGTYTGTVKINSNSGNKDISTVLNLETWITRAPMPTQRCYFGACVLDNKIYAIGGWNGSKSLAVVEEYDPATNRWTIKRVMPQPRVCFCACALDGKIYAIGGLTTLGSDQIVKSTVYVYDAISDSWSIGVPLPIELTLLAACVVEGKIYVVGGTRLSASGPHPTAYEFDPSTDQWTEKKSMPTPRSGHGACVIDGKIFTFGGVGSMVAFDDVEIYDPSTDSWEQKQPMAMNRFYFGTSVVEGKIYIMGGCNLQMTPFDYNDEYDLNADTWLSREPMPTKRYGLSSCAVNGQIFVIGGSDVIPEDSGPALSVVEAFTP